MSADDVPYAELPSVVRAAAARAEITGSAPRQVRVKQEGQMWLKPGGRGLRFRATEAFAVDRVAFAWQARFPLLGPLALRVVDGYAGGDGTLEVRLLGLPLQRQRGPEVVAGEALRYLAELAWAPHALTANRELEWRELGDRRAEVATTVAGERLNVTVEFDADAQIVAVSSADRRRKVGNTWVATPWGGRFGDHRMLGGIRVPSWGEAYWELPERYVYWRGTVTGVELLDEPFAVDAIVLPTR